MNDWIDSGQDKCDYCGSGVDVSPIALVGPIEQVNELKCAGQDDSQVLIKYNRVKHKEGTVYKGDPHMADEFPQEAVVSIIREDESED